MRKLKLINAKFFLFVLALLLPVTITGIVGTFFKNYAFAEDESTSSSTTYYKNYVESVSLTNKNFNSSTITSISQNPSGWTKQISDSKTTAGIINVGNNFDNYKNSTYYLSVNPSSKANDNQILMINSKTSKDQRQMSREGYASNSVTLSANSFYSFQVSFKSDTNYKENTTYVERGNVDNEVTIYQSNFNSAKFGEYVSMTYRSSTYYAKKELSSQGPLSGETTSTGAFYNDGEYVGFLYENGDDTTPIYVSTNDIKNIIVSGSTELFTNPDEPDNTTTLGEDATILPANFEKYDEDYLKFNYNGVDYYVDKSDVNYTFNASAEYSTCSITFQPNGSSTTSGTYKLSSGASYFSQSVDYESYNEYGVGSIYLKGLTDENGDEVDLSYEKVSSTEWTTFYFFVATGDKEQTVNLELWLGSDTFNDNSTGVVFFDDVVINQYSENTFYDTYLKYKNDKFYNQVSSETKTSSVKFKQLIENDYVEIVDHNLDFEDDNSVTALKGWTKNGNGSAQIIYLESKEGFEATTGYSYVGSNLKVSADFDEDGNVKTVYKNEKALALWADNGYVEATSKPIDIKAHGLYKISAYYKIAELDGTIYLKVNETEYVLDANNLTEDTYTLSNGSSSATANADNKFVNNYGKIEIFVKGSNLYNSQVNITLAVGSSEEAATGCVVFDDITVENVSYTEYTEAEHTVELNAISGEPTITNGYFNVTENTDFTYPLTPSGWTIEKNEGLTFGGVINTKDSEYKFYKEQYELNKDLAEKNPYLWAQFPNPMNVDGTTTYSNNILMLANYNSNYQNVTSPTFTLNANSYYKLTFDFKTLSTELGKTARFNLGLYNEDGVLLYEEKDISSTDWKQYTVYFETFKGAESVYAKIDFGTEDNLIVGYAYFDNFELATIESADFETIKENKDNNVVDMTDYYVNLPTTEVTDNIKDFKSDAYQTSANTDNSFGGIVEDGYFENDLYFKLDKETTDPVKVFMMQNNTPGTYSIQSVFKFDLTSGNYYKLTFKLKTKIVYKDDGNSVTDDDFDINNQNYGVSVGLTGFDYMTNLKSTDEYNEYTLYIHATEDANANLYMAFVSDHYLTTGTAVLYDINFEELSADDDSSAEEFNNAKDLMDKDGYDINEDRVFATETASDEEDGDDTTDEDTTDDTTNNDEFTWLLLTSTLITALAIIIAVVGWSLRKVKIKKIETKRKETYDRKGSLHKDVIRQEAEQERAQQVKELEEDIKKFETELESLEKEHKEKVVKLRKEDKKEISKSTEKEFKLFAQKRTVIAEKLDILKHQLENVKSPEHLLSLERKKYAENEAKQKELQKASKKANKEDSKKVESTDKEKGKKTKKDDAKKETKKK